MKKGFSLVELLVVIAIIGILSAVVLASLSETRKRGVENNNYKIKTQTQGYMYVYSYRKENDGACVYVPEKEFRYCGEWSATKLNNKE